MAKRISWWQAAGIVGISDRSMRRWRERYQERGYDGLLDRRRGKPSGKRAAVEVLEEVLRLHHRMFAAAYALGRLEGKLRLDFSWRRFHQWRDDLGAADQSVGRRFRSPVVQE
jgi:transposase